MHSKNSPAQMDDTAEEETVETENDLVQQTLTHTDVIVDAVEEEIAETEDDLVRQT